ncbi:MAG: Uncharacterized conserved membrane protein, UPF0127 family [Chloroflexi bacterium]|jgi:uncharacterized membrane protein (UPF0127 family)|nr:MAG: Uncharacterized conserved membrane protein, UPF0127 family [Chloroflexota bacterium]|tara:strand:- start:7668 stop:8165 length:498 start_codon:yes stop_codon:yes gene_type:complete
MKLIKNKNIILCVILIIVISYIIFQNNFKINHATNELNNNFPSTTLPIAQFLNPITERIVKLPVEVPLEIDYGIGLSNRKQLSNRGMLFTFQNSNKHRGFSMKNTYIDLSIAFINAEKKIVSIKEMTALNQNIYTINMPFKYAIEAPKHWFTKNKIEIGYKVILP